MQTNTYRILYECKPYFLEPSFYLLQYDNRVVFECSHFLLIPFLSTNALTKLTEYVEYYLLVISHGWEWSTWHINCEILSWNIQWHAFHSQRPSHPLLGFQSRLLCYILPQFTSFSQPKSSLNLMDCKPQLRWQYSNRSRRRMEKSNNYLENVFILRTEAPLVTI
jgi:hypothetical protein